MKVESEIELMNEVKTFLFKNSNHKKDVKKFIS